MKMKEFNLEKALAGEPVITRNGVKVTNITHIDVGIPKPVVGLIGRSLCLDMFGLDGRRDIHDEHPDDLFMAPIKKEYWINLYYVDLNESYMSSSIFNSEKEALDAIDIEAGYIKTIKLYEEMV